MNIQDKHHLISVNTWFSEGFSGKKMSKSLGNGIDHLVIEKYGADALRFIITICPGNDMRFTMNKWKQVENFANKYGIRLVL